MDKTFLARHVLARLWFDMLNKANRCPATVKPNEKSQEEEAKD